MDVFTKEKRSEVMSRIRGKDTKLEVRIRSELFRKGFRFRKNDKRYPGKPDIVFPKYKAVVFINGCFWHYHECELFKMPSTRKKWWEKKLNRNRSKDHEALDAIKQEGLRALVVWECAIRGKGKNKEEQIFKTTRLIERWVQSKSKHREISG